MVCQKSFFTVIVAVGSVSSIAGNIRFRSQIDSINLNQQKTDEKFKNSDMYDKKDKPFVIDDNVGFDVSNDEISAEDLGLSNSDYQAHESATRVYWDVASNNKDEIYEEEDLSDEEYDEIDDIDSEMVSNTDNLPIEDQIDTSKFLADKNIIESSELLDKKSLDSTTNYSPKTTSENDTSFFQLSNLFFLLTSSVIGVVVILGLIIYFYTVFKRQKHGTNRSHRRLEDSVNSSCSTDDKMFTADQNLI